MTMIGQVGATLKKYADFSECAARSEFWIFFFFVLVANFIARLVDTMFSGGGYLPGPVAGLTMLLLIVPQLAVAVRRLHDLGRSGRDLALPLLLLAGAPLVAMFGSLLGRIVALGYAGVTLLLFANLLLILIKEGKKVPNRHGASPTAFSFGS